MTRLMSLSEVETLSAKNRAAHVVNRADDAAVSMPISLSLPWPPSINHYYQRRRDGNVFIGADGKNYRRAVGSYCMAWKVKPLPGRVQAIIVCSPPDKRKRDLDNLMKCLLDSLQHGGCFKDDSQIHDLRIVRATPIKAGRVQVELIDMDANK